jgi:hypothetical protein
VLPPSVVTVIISTAAAMALMTRYPQLALRIFTAEPHDLELTYFYAVELPSSHIVVVGLPAFALTFAWFFTRTSARRA